MNWDIHMVKACYACSMWGCFDIFFLPVSYIFSLSLSLGDDFI